MQIAAGFLLRAADPMAVEFCDTPPIMLNAYLTDLPEALASWLRARVERYRARLLEVAGVSLPDAAMVLAAKVFLASDFAFDVAERRPDEFADLLSDPDAAPDWLDQADENSTAFAARLRQFRRLGSARLIVRDLAAVDSVEATLQGASALALVCIAAALRHAEIQLAERFGSPRSSAGVAQSLVVIGMGKLGGGELNFSSDVDLILAFPEAGQTDGRRPLDNEEYFARLGQRLAQLLGDVTADGFVLRVDYRLRPFGGAGRIALSFNAMEQYYQREGRDWERYAWIKAAAVAGDLDAGRQLIESLRPFVYRRYLDFTAIEGLRDLKGRIDQEVDRKDLADNLKLGPGGIRELEFAVQLAQLIRGGREASLRVSGFLSALAALAASEVFDAATARQLRAHYRFLRCVENRVQMLHDEQTHSLPTAPTDRLRIALALGYADVNAMQTAINSVRTEVQSLFAATLDGSVRRQQVDLEGGPGASTEPSGGEPSPEHTAPVRVAIEALLAALPIRRMDVRGRERFERALPLLLLAASTTPAPEAAALRLLRLLHAIAGRPSYLALLAERRGARERLADVFARSAFLADRVIAHPLLLDDLLDARVDAEVLADAGFSQLLERALARVGVNDAEAELIAIHEARQSAVFRTALTWLDRSESALAITAKLARIAALSVQTILRWAERDLATQHGSFPAGLLIVAYGSFGGGELGFGSDLDLVFLFDPVLANQQSQGARALDGGRYLVRLSQRVLHWLATPTHAGALYPVDVRLRPDGAKGLLVSPLDAFRDYQLQRAWVWEHQALLRARAVAGPEALATAFSRVRREVLCQPRDPLRVRREVSQMRARWRHELDRSSTSQFDLKQGPGGLVDIEFLLQGLLLMHAAEQPALIERVNTVELIESCVTAALLSAVDAERLQMAHADWLARSLDCTLNAHVRVVPRNAEIDATALAVRAIIYHHGFAETMV